MSADWLTQTELMRWVPIGSVFTLTLSLWLGLLMWWSMRRAGEQQKIHRRLGLTEEITEQTRVLNLWIDGKLSTTTVSDLVESRSIARRLQMLPQRIGWNGPASSLLLTILGTSALAAVTVLLSTQHALAAIVAAGATLGAWWVYVGRRMNQHNALFQAQFLDALELVARSLRAGHPVIGAFQLAADEMDPPISRVFGSVCQQQALGLNIDDALRRTAAAQPSEDFRFFTAAICIAMHSGGNLADMIDRLADVIRDRIRLGRRVRVLTSQAQFSKRVLLTLPLVLGLILYLLHPQYMSPLATTSAGNVLLIVGAVSMLLGAWAMNRLARLRY